MSTNPQDGSPLSRKRKTGFNPPPDAALLRPGQTLGERKRKWRADEMDVRFWYEVDVLMADLTVHHHTMAGGSEKEIERRIEDRYPNAVAILVHRQKTKDEVRP